MAKNAFQDRLRRVLVYENGNVSATSRRLGVSRSTVRRWRDGEVAQPTTRHSRELSRVSGGVRGVQRRQGRRVVTRGDTTFVEGGDPIDEILETGRHGAVTRAIHTVPVSQEYPNGKKSTPWLNSEGYTREMVVDWLREVGVPPDSDIFSVVWVWNP